MMRCSSRLWQCTFTPALLVSRTVRQAGIHKVVRNSICHGVCGTLHTISTRSDRSVSKVLSMTEPNGSSKPACLVVGATRGLGQAITRRLVDLNKYTVYATSRSAGKDVEGVDRMIQGIDLSQESAGPKLVEALKGVQLHCVFMVAGYFSKESIDTPLSWSEEVKMYSTCAIGPLFVIHALVNANILASGSKLCIITSEGGSITLRTVEEGGGMYGHHASKAAQNMVGKLLSFDLKPRGIPVVMIHPGFLKTDLTKSVGFDQYYVQGGAVAPEEAVGPLLEFMDELTLENTGKFIAPLGPKGVGNTHVIGPLETLPKKNLELPW